METINIKGKEYVQVNERLKEFRTNKNYEGWQLVSELVQLTEKFVVFKASIINKVGVVVANGFAQEDRDSSVINKTSYVENCESSAWGRALGNLGIGIDVAICSAEEVKTAIDKQEKIEKKEAKEITLDYALSKTTSKGKTYGEISDEQLEWIINSDKASQESKQCAKLVLDDRKKLQEDEFIEISDDKDLPF